MEQGYVLHYKFVDGRTARYTIKIALKYWSCKQRWMQ